MKKTSLISFFFLLICSCCAIAENRQHAIDSLMKLYRQPNIADTSRANLLNELSRETSEMDSNTVAMEFAMQAKALSEKNNYRKGIAVALSNMAYIYSQQGDYPKSLELYFSSLKMCDSVSDAMRIFLIYNSIGTIYYFQRDNSLALYYYKLAEKKDFNSGLTHVNMGMVYSDLNDFQSALNCYNKSLSYFTLHNDRNGIGSTLQNIGNVYEDKKDYESALDYYLKALKIKQEVKDNKGECGALGSIGDVYFEQKKYSDAIDYETKSLQLAKAIRYISSAVQTEQVLSEIYEKMNNTSEAFHHYKQFIILRDSIYNEENTKKTVRAEMNYSFDKKQEAQKADQEKKDAITKIIIVSVSVGLFLVLILSGFIFREYRAKKKANLIILEQKQEVEEQKKLIEEKQKEVLASIRYAKRIQQALLPTELYINKSLKRLIN